MKLDPITIETTDPQYDPSNPDQQLYKVPGYPMLAISRNGLCFNLRSNSHVNLRNRHGSPVNEFNPFFDLNIYGGKKMTRIDWLLALTFNDDYPEGYSIVDAEKLEARHKDGMRGPCSADNVYWAVPDEIIFMDSSTSDDEKLYQLPSTPFLAVNRKGQVKNLSTGYFIEIWTNPKGYKISRPTYKGVAKGYPVHRLIGEIFVEPRAGCTIEQCIRFLVINHKDANPSNNDPDNLEWVTVKENVHHALDNGLNGNLVPCVIRHLVRGTELYFDSIAKLSRFLKLTTSSVVLIVNSDRAGKRNRFDYVFKKDDGSVWPDSSECDSYDKWAFRLSYTVYYPNGTERACLNKFEIMERLNNFGLEINTLGETITKGYRIVGKLIPITKPELMERAITSREEFGGYAYSVTDTRLGRCVDYVSGRQAANAIGMIHSTFRSRTRKYSAFNCDHYVVEVLNNIHNRPPRVGH